MGRLFVGALIAALVVACSPTPTPGTQPPGPSPATTGPTSSSTPTTTQTAAADCGFLPAGVDPRACGVPAAVEAPIPSWESDPEVYSFTAGDGQIRCDANGSGNFVACAFGFALLTGDPATACDAGDWDNDFVYLWQNVQGGWETGQGGCRSDALVAETEAVPALPDDAVLVLGELAVVAGPTGITVWHGAERRGFDVSDDRVVSW